jgi:cytochrome c oxidase assembly protein subunit 15
MVHGTLAVAVLLLAIALSARLSRNPGAGVARARVRTLVIVLLAQGLVGIAQALSALPAVLVVLHLLGAALVWVGVLRVLLDVSPRLFGTVRASGGDAADGPLVSAAPGERFLRP